VPPSISSGVLWQRHTHPNLKAPKTPKGDCTCYLLPFPTAMCDKIKQAVKLWSRLELAQDFLEISLFNIWVAIVIVPLIILAQQNNYIYQLRKIRYDRWLKFTGCLLIVVNVMKQPASEEMVCWEFVW
jgi:hypothetical protein